MFVEIPIAYPGPKLTINKDCDLCNFGWIGLIKYLLSEVSTSIFALNEGDIIVDTNEIIFILEKETLYKRGIIAGGLIGYLYDKLESLNLGIDFNIDTSLVAEKLYLKIEVVNKDDINSEALTGLLRIKGIGCTVDELQTWIMQSMGIYSYNYANYTFKSCNSLKGSTFMNLQAIGNKVYSVEDIKEVTIDE